MFEFHAEIKKGNKGSAAEHCRYDARMGKWSAQDDLLAFAFGNMPEWSRDHPLTFWKYADAWERNGGAAYREWIIALPNQLSIETNIALMKEIAQTVVGPRPWQAALHGPEAEFGGCINLHCHLMYSDRLTTAQHVLPIATSPVTTQPIPSVAAAESSVAARPRSR